MTSNIFIFPFQLQYFFLSNCLHLTKHPTFEHHFIYPSQRGGAHYLKAFQISLPVKANWWEARLHEYASRLYYRSKRS